MELAREYGRYGYRRVPALVQRWLVYPAATGTQAWHIVVLENYGPEHTGTLNVRLRGRRRLGSKPTTKWAFSFPDVRIPARIPVRLHFQGPVQLAKGSYLFEASFSGAAPRLVRSGFCANCNVGRGLVVSRNDDRRTLDYSVRADGLHIQTYYLDDDVTGSRRSNNARPNKNVFVYMLLTKPPNAAPWIRDGWGRMEPYAPGSSELQGLATTDETGFWDRWWGLIVVNFGRAAHTGTLTFELQGPSPWKRSFPAVSVPGRRMRILSFKGGAPEPTVPTTKPPKAGEHLPGQYLLKGTFTGAAGPASMTLEFCGGMRGWRQDVYAGTIRLPCTPPAASSRASRRSSRDGPD